MLGIGWGEILLIIIVMVIVLKPSEWPAFFKFVADLYRTCLDSVMHLRTTCDDLTRELQIETLTQKSYEDALAASDSVTESLKDTSESGVPPSASPPPTS